jgi:hypothetical protein
MWQLSGWRESGAFEREYLAYFRTFGEFRDQGSVPSLNTRSGVPGRTRFFSPALPALRCIAALPQTHLAHPTGLNTLREGKVLAGFQIAFTQPKKFFTFF